MNRRLQWACYTGYIVQAVSLNFVPLLFLLFQDELGIPISLAARLVELNFMVQLLTDLCSFYLLRFVSYKCAFLLGQFISALGLLLLALLPGRMDAMPALILAVFFMAVGSGLTEVLLSPIIECVSTTHKAASMSLLHSFYCWGYLVVVLLSTAFFQIIGLQHWRILASLWALLPIGNGLMAAGVPFPAVPKKPKGVGAKPLRGVRWLVLPVMFFAGAIEHSISQWSSAVSEAELMLPKWLGDMGGVCLFALLMGLGRTVYGLHGFRCSEKVILPMACLGCTMACLMIAFAPKGIAIIGFGIGGLCISVIWPWMCARAAQWTSSENRTQLFVLLAIFGDIGCAFGPGLVGWFVRQYGAIRWGYCAVSVMPILLSILLHLLKNKKNQRNAC